MFTAGLPIFRKKRPVLDPVEGVLGGPIIDVKPDIGVVGVPILGGEIMLLPPHLGQRGVSRPFDVTLLRADPPRPFLLG